MSAQATDEHLLTDDAVAPDPASAPLPPGPRGLPGLGVAPMLARDLYEYPRRMAREYGDVVRLPVPGTSLILVSHPDHVNHVFNRHTSRYWKGEMNRRLIDGIRARGIEAVPMPVADGPEWKRMRKAVSPMFGHRHLRPLASVMAAAIEQRVATWDRYAGGPSVDFDPELSTLTMDVLMQTMFGVRLDEATLARAATEFRTYAIGSAVRMATWWAPTWLPVPYGRRSDRAEQWIDDFCRAFVAQRQATGADGDDLLGALLDVRLEDQTALTEDEILAELSGFVFGGHETTSAALSWTLALLDLHPAARARVEQEIAALGDDPLGYDDLDHLPFLRACFDEAQRIQGGPFYARQPLADDVIGGYRIPKDAIVVVSPYTMHRDERFWAEPASFRPERFLPDAPDAVEKYAYLPFNVGPRRCVGMHFANIEAVLTLAAALRRYRFRFGPGFTPRHTFHISTGLAGGCRVTLERR